MGDKKLYALLKMCESADVPEVVLKDAAERMEKGRIGRVLTHVVEAVKAKRSPCFEPDRAELMSAIRMAAEVMRDMNMRKTHIAEFKYLVGVAALTPTDAELDAIAAMSSDIRREQIDVANALARRCKPSLLDLLMGRVSLTEWRGGPPGRQPVVDDGVGYIPTCPIYGAGLDEP